MTKLFKKKSEEINQDFTPMTSAKIEWYKNEIKRLEEIDNKITLRVQQQLNVMDQKSVSNG
tara:strand:+ start:6156 stop:6338 length:183 start_codon:yes stop_codon:yes gene_type:complete